MLHATLTLLRKFDLLVIAILFLLLAAGISMERSIEFMIFCIFVLAYDLLYGYMGRLSFGHMLYLGVGAYAFALSGELSVGQSLPGAADRGGFRGGGGTYHRAHHRAHHRRLFCAD